MKKIRCEECGLELDEYSYGLRIVDEDSDLERRVCQYCEENMEDNGELTRCECCGMVFSPSRLKVNPENGETEICPYCNEVWCD